MEEQFIPYDQALALKELGFNDVCFAVYEESGQLLLRYKSKNSTYKNSRKMGKYSDLQICTAPLWQQAFDWLFNNFSYICTVENNLSYEQKREKLEQAIRNIQNNKP